MLSDHEEEMSAPLNIASSERGCRGRTTRRYRPGRPGEDYCPRWPYDVIDAALRAAEHIFATDGSRRFVKPPPFEIDSVGTINLTSPFSHFTSRGFVSALLAVLIDINYYTSNSTSRFEPAIPHATKNGKAVILVYMVIPILPSK